MRRFVATMSLCWFALCSTDLPTNNIAPLAFGMTQTETAAALGTTLIYLGGRPGSEVFIADRSADVPGLYPVDERYSLQFRKGHLTGWKRQWQTRRFLFF